MGYATWTVLFLPPKYPVDEPPHWYILTEWGWAMFQWNHDDDTRLGSPPTNLIYCAPGWEPPQGCQILSWGEDPE